MHYSIVTTSSSTIIGKYCPHIVAPQIIDNAQVLVERCFDMLCSSDTCVVAFDDDDEIIGYCALDLTTGLHVEALCVEPRHRYRGHGKSILNIVLQIGRTLNSKYPNWISELHPHDVFESRIGYITLEVDRYSRKCESLIVFYQKCGFEVFDQPGHPSCYCRKIIEGAYS